MTTQEEDEATMEEYKEMLKDTLATVGKELYFGNLVHK